MGTSLVLATRRSPLALAQAELAAAHLRARLGVDCRLLEVVTTGDRQADWSLEEKGGKGLFTRELEAAVLRGHADVAIHSAKDLPGESVPGLTTAGYLVREDPRDVLVVRSGMDAPKRIATGSPRGRSQAAMDAWQQSLQAARSRGAEYEVALTERAAAEADPTLQRPLADAGSSS